MSTSGNDTLYFYADNLIYKVSARNNIIRLSEPYFHNNRLRQFYVDRLNNLWVSVWAHGVSLGINNGDINYFSVRRQLQSEVKYKTVYSLDIDKSNGVWLAYDDGVMLFDNIKGKKKGNLILVKPIRSIRIAQAEFGL